MGEGMRGSRRTSTLDMAWQMRVRASSANMPQLFSDIDFESSIATTT
jgi:hypothetical protein